MNEPDTENRIKEAIASAVVLSVVGYVVWPWGDVPWKWVTYLPDSLNGDLAVLVLTVAVSAIVGFGIKIVSGIRLSNFAIGGVVAYAFWMTVVTIALSLHEPLLPVITYGLVLLGALLGAASVERRTNYL